MFKFNPKIAIFSASFFAFTYGLESYAFDVNEVKDGDKPYMTEFKSLDKNNSGEISWSDTKADKAVKHKDFVAYDKDKDGTLTYDEYADLKTHLAESKIKTATSDTWITTQAKSKLLAEASLKSFKISVETHAGLVILSGFVNDPALREKAESIVAGIDGVKSVENAIIVKG